MLCISVPSFTPRAHLEFKSPLQEKNTVPSKGYGVFFGLSGETQITRQSALLADPNALHFGTRLHTTWLKTIINRFLYATCSL